jgi:CBS domain-containing membrane protein
MSEPREPRTLLEKLEEFEAEVVHGLVKYLSLHRLLGRFPARPVWAGFMFISGFLTIGLLAAVAKVSRIPFVFPSLGPTAFLFFFSPRSPASSPRNAIYGHALGILCGYGSLWAAGLQDMPSAMQEGVNWPRVLAAALSLALTGVFMILLKVAHPPAGATTLIVSLGIVTEPLHLLILEVAVLLMVLQAIAINRLAGIDYPLWSRGVPVRVLEPPASPSAERKTS